MPETKMAMLGECVEWSGARQYSGYGVWTSPTDENGKRKKWRAHRLAWTVLVGPIPEGQYVLHHCDNPPCVNTDHLFLGTHADNMADKVAKGRQARGESLAAKRRGAANGRAKLTEDDVRAIRADTRLLREIAEDYGIVNQQVSMIKSRQKWGHVK